MLVIVTGTRHARNTDPGHCRTIWRAMLAVHRAADGRVRMSHGHAKGADDLAAAYGHRLGWGVRGYPAQWSAPCGSDCKPGHRRAWVDGGTYCPFAGHRRNQKMVDDAVAACAPHSTWQWGLSFADLLCLAFPLDDGSSAGTGDCMGRAERAGIRVDPHPLPFVPAQPQRAAGMKR